MCIPSIYTRIVFMYSIKTQMLLSVFKCMKAFTAIIGIERSMVKIWPNFVPKSRFGFFLIRKSDLDKNWHHRGNWPYKQACKGVFDIFQKSDTYQ